MTFFVDANVIVYAAGASAYGAACLEIIHAIGTSTADGRTSTVALDEVWHLELSGRVPDLAGTARDGYTVFTPLLPVADEAFRLALEVDAPRLGANDRLHLGTCLAHGIETIVSADAGFDGVKEIRRVDPLDERARRRLLA